MSTVIVPEPVAAPVGLTIADLARRFGPMPFSRIRFNPIPGMATEQDVLDIHAREKRLCELIDGILVEKTGGLRESILAVYLSRLLDEWAASRRLGVVTGPDGTMGLMPGLVRIPDAAFISWDRLPGRRIPDEPIPDLVPDLAVEVLSASNTREEMEQKLRDYFAAGVRLVWYVQPRGRTVDVYTSATQSIRLTEAETLDGGAVLPGFTLPLRDFFVRLDVQG